MGDDNVVKGGVGAAEAGEADFEDHGGRGGGRGDGDGCAFNGVAVCCNSQLGGNFGVSHMPCSWSQLSCGGDASIVVRSVARAILPILP